MSALRSYEDFEPLSEWVHEEGFRTLLIHLPGFKRNQIKVQITSTNHAKISGERPLDNRRWSRFVKQFPLPEHCKVAEIQAKFENGGLRVKIPIAQVAPSTTMHISLSSPMEKEATELREKTQEGDGKSRKAVAEGEFLQKEQKQPEAKEEVGHKEHPKANGDQEKKQEKLQNKEKTEEGRSNGEKIQGQQMSPALKTDDTFRQQKQEKLQGKEKTEEGRSNGEKIQGQQMSPALKTDDTFRQEKQAKLRDKEQTEEGRSNGQKIQGQQMRPALKADDTFRQEKETEQPESKDGEMMAKYSINNLLMELTPDKKILLVNVAVSALIFLGIGLYLMYKRGDE